MFPPRTFASLRPAFKTPRNLIVGEYLAAVNHTTNPIFNMTLAKIEQ